MLLVIKIVSEGFPRTIFKLFLKNINKKDVFKIFTWIYKVKSWGYFGILKVLLLLFYYLYNILDFSLFYFWERLSSLEELGS